MIELPDVSRFNCRICGSVDLGRIGLNQDFGLPVFQCATCGFRQTYPLSDDFLNLYYENAYSSDHGRADNPAYVEFSAKRGEVQKTFVQRVTGDRKFKRVLDLGAGAGGALDAYSDDGSELACWDPDPFMRAVLATRNKIETISPNELFSGQYDKHFDLIILSHVLEHLNDPRVTLLQARQLLTDDGVAFIEVPAESEFARICVSESLRTGLGHLLFFDTTTLRTLIEKDGLFEILSIEQYGVAIEDFYSRGVALTFDDTEPNNDGVWIRCVVRARTPDSGTLADAQQSVSGTMIGYTAAAYELNQRRNALITIVREFYDAVRSVIGEPGAKLNDAEKAIPFADPPTAEIEEAANLLRERIESLEAHNDELQRSCEQQVRAIEALEIALHKNVSANDVNELLRMRLGDAQSAVLELKQSNEQAEDKIARLETEIERLRQC